ncbi:MAG: HAD-IA family hydrolase [Paracoccaceae bacterium]
MKRIRCIAWDFDGVLNNNVVNGHFIWQDSLRDLGIDRQDFETFMFADGFWPIMRGEEDLLHRLARYKAHAGFAAEPEELLNFWFKTDAFPSDRMLDLMAQLDAAGIRQIIATNNEHRRSCFIEDQMGYSARVEKLYSSGRMGVAKPDPVYFQAIEADIGLSPQEILFIDDYPENVDAAKSCGWQAHHFPENGYDDLREKLAVIL